MAGVATSRDEVLDIFRRARSERLLVDRRSRASGPLALLNWRSLTSEEATLPASTLPEARYQCEMCGESCHAGYEVGPAPFPLPLDTRDIVSFPVPTDAHDTRRFPLPTDGPGSVSCSAGSGPLQTPLQTEAPTAVDRSSCSPDHTDRGRLAPHLRRIDGACSQLDPTSHLCRIHATAGFHRKPQACRDFPLVLSLTPTGLRLSLQWECTRLHRALRFAPPLKTHLPASLLGAQAAIAPDALPLGDGRLIPFARYARLEALVLDRIAAADPDRLAPGLPLLISSLGRRDVDPIVLLDRLDACAATELAEAFVLDAAPVLGALRRQARALLPAARYLAAGDRRRLYLEWLLRVLDGWHEGRGVVLPEVAAPDLWRAWLRNRIFGLGLLKGPDLFAGAVDVGLRYLVARVGMAIPLDLPLEGSVGAAENRRIVAVEHTLREERMAPVMWEARAALSEWLEDLIVD